MCFLFAIVFSLIRREEGVLYAGFFWVDDLMDSIPESFTFFYFLQSISYNDFICLVLTSQQFYFCNFCKVHSFWIFTWLVFDFTISLYNLSRFIIDFLIPLVIHGLISSFFIFLGSLFSRSTFVESSFK